MEMEQRPETDDQRAERLIIDLQETFTVQDRAGKALLEYYQGSIKGRQVFCLFRVFDEVTWMRILAVLMDFETGEGYLLKVCKRYLKNNKGQLGFLWEITLDADNLEEAVDAFRQVLMSTVYTVLEDDAEAPNHPVHNQVQDAAAGRQAPAPPMRRRPAQAKRVDPGKRGVTDPNTVQPDGSILVPLPTRTPGIAPGFSPDKQALVTDTNKVLTPPTFKVDKNNKRVRVK